MAELLFSSRSWSPTVRQTVNPVHLRTDHWKTYGGGDGRSTKKKNSRRGKLNEKKILARQLTLKNIHAMA